MDKDTMDRLLEQFADDPDLQALQRQLSDLERRLKSVVSEEAWDLLLEWEALWAQYVTLCLEKLQQSAEEQTPDK